MPDCFGKAQRSAVMRAVKSQHTSAERLALALLQPTGSPDIVIPSFRAVVFVHGCFWHGHDCRRGSRVPRTRRVYWVRKIARNRKRDRANARRLRADGWHVYHLWECRLTPAHAASLATKLLGTHREASVRSAANESQKPRQLKYFKANSNHSGPTMMSWTKQFYRGHPQFEIIGYN
jgi:DNA mismatch endonuclease, patch repair protein